MSRLRHRRLLDARTQGPRFGKDLDCNLARIENEEHNLLESYEDRGSSYRAVRQLGPDPGNVTTMCLTMQRSMVNLLTPSPCPI